MNNKQKIDFRLEAKKEADKSIVYLYGDIVDEKPTSWLSGEELDVEYISPKKVREIMDEVEDEDVEIHINSYGGSVFASVSIFNYLKSLDKNITVYIDGIAASGASLIAMAGQKIVMPANTMMMIHRASTFGFGNSVELRKIADTLDKLDNSIVLETYKKRFKGSDEDLIELLDKETWISAKEALEYGLADEVIHDEDNRQDDTKESEDLENEEIENAIKFMKNFANLKI